LFGQCVCAIAQSFIDIAGPKLAANWFPPKERTTATALASGPIFAAVLVSYAVIPRTVQSGSDIPMYLLAEAGLSTLSAILIFTIFRGSPPSPPSYSAAVEKMKIGEALKALASNRNFILLFFVFGINLGCALSFSVLMDQIVAPAGYSNTDAGTISSIWISSAIVGGVMGGIFIDKTHAYKLFMVGTLSFATIGIVWFTLTLIFVPKNMVLLCVIIAFIGLGASGVPAILEATIETVYPVPEATAMGILFLGLNITAIVFTLSMSKLQNPKTGSMINSLWCTVGLCTVGLVFAVLFKGNYQRLAFEKQAKKEVRQSEILRQQEQGMTPEASETHETRPLLDP